MIDRKTQMSDTWATKQITPDEICRAYRDVDVDDITVLKWSTNFVDIDL